MPSIRTAEEPRLLESIIARLPAGQSTVVRVRLCAGDADAPDFASFDALVQQRRQEADAFYAVLAVGHRR